MIDIAGNRQARKYSAGAQAARIAWALARPAFAWSPRPFWGWRRFLLRLFGAKVGRDVHVYPSVRIAMPWNLTVGEESAIGDRALVYNLGPARIGSRVTISHQAHLCGGTHDHRDPRFELQKCAVTVEDGAWICADAFIGPNVTVGTNAIVAARAVVTKDVDPGMIVAGNPAQLVSPRAGDKH